MIANIKTLKEDVSKKPSNLKQQIQNKNKNDQRKMFNFTSTIKSENENQNEYNLKKKTDYERFSCLINNNYILDNTTISNLTTIKSKIKYLIVNRL